MSFITEQCININAVKNQSEAIINGGIIIAKYFTHLDRQPDIRKEGINVYIVQYI